LSTPADTKRTVVAAMAVVFAALMLFPSSAAEAPWIGVVSPEDGGWVIDPDLKVQGNATPPIITLDLGETFLSNGTGFGFTMDGANLTMRPRELFSDEFTDTTLDTDKWQVLRYGAGISFANGHMKLTNQAQNYPLLRTVGTSFPANADWMARFQMQMLTLGYSGSGGGISTTSTDTGSSHLAAYNLWAGWNTDSYKVYSNGIETYSDASDHTDHQYVLSYDADRGRFTSLMDGDELDTFTSVTMPNQFWFGATTQGMYQFYSHLEIDFVDVWAFNGIRTFDPIEFPHTTVVDSIKANWTTNRPADADVMFEARMSEDNRTWSMWLPMIDGVPPEEMQGTFLQVRIKASLKGLRESAARIRIGGIEVQRHHPVTLVEVRNVDTDGVWMNATGREAWKATVPLQEDLNTIQVRVTDTAGEVNVTSFEQVLDTTPPTGTMHILKDRTYTNNLNVSLQLNATDRYGIEFVAISNARDMRDAIMFPYKENIEWTMGGDDGEVACFVRFIDPHGLASDMVSDTIIYDSIAPSGELSIFRGKPFTPSLTVDLDLVYSDTRGVGLVELSNHANLSDIRTVPEGDETYRNWTLTDGGDGPRTVYMRMTDLAGNSRVVSDTIEYYQPKVLGGMTMEDGANITKNSAVRIEIDVPLLEGPRMMQLSNDAAFMDAVWETVDDQAVWILSSGDGPKVVYLRFLDYREVISLPVNASIFLDTTAPRVDLFLDGGAEYTIDEEVEVTLDYTDATDAAAMWVARVDRFNEADEEPFSATFIWTVPPREGIHGIYVQVQDMAGNAVVVHGSIWFASILPKVRVTLPEGDVTGSSDHVVVSVVTEDRYGGIEYVRGIDEDPLEGGQWLPEEGTLWVPFREGTSEGNHRVTVRARNTAGLVSDMVAVNFTLDLTPPVLSLVAPLDGDILAQRGLDVMLQLTAHDPTGISEVRYRLDGGQWVTVPDEQLTAVITLDDFGDHTIEAEVTDGVGNAGTVSTSFRVDDSEAQVTSGDSWTMLIVLVVIVVIIGIAFEVYRHREGGGLLGILGHRTPPEADIPVAPVDVPGEPQTEQVPPDPLGAVPEPAQSEDVVHVDDDGVEWEMA